MKRILFGSVSALIMATTPTPLLAQDITPVALVFQGYQGFFVEQGVPSSGAFLHAIHFGRVDAKTLVKNAIARGRLSPETINDQSYLRKVNTALFRIQRSGGMR